MWFKLIKKNFFKVYPYFIGIFSKFYDNENIMLKREKNFRPHNSSTSEKQKNKALKQV